MKLSDQCSYKTPEEREIEGGGKGRRLNVNTTKSVLGMCGVD